MTDNTDNSVNGVGEKELKEANIVQNDANPTEIRFGGPYSIGKTIAREGPGEGYASYPWALDHYERELGLTPRETWLLKRMLKYAWDFGKPVYISLRKVTREAIISSATLNRDIKSLTNKGYIRVVNRGENLDRRIRYDIVGLYFALAYSIRSNPNSKTCKRFKITRNMLDRLTEEAQNLIIDEIPNDERITIGMINDILNRKGFYIDWCNCYLKILPDGPMNTNKLSTNDVMTRIRGEDLDDDFNGYREDAFDG